MVGGKPQRDACQRGADAGTPGRVDVLRGHLQAQGEDFGDEDEFAKKAAKAGWRWETTLQKRRAAKRYKYSTELLTMAQVQHVGFAFHERTSRATGLVFGCLSAVFCCGDLAGAVTL